MTTKELSYIEDALGHEKHFQTRCQEAISQLQDENLKSCVKGLCEKHQEIFNSLYELL